MANIQVVISALNNASGEINKVKQEIAGVKTAGDDAAEGTGAFNTSLGGLIGTVSLAVGAIAGVGLALKEVYDSAKEAAELEFAETRFDNLAAAIGSTADALLLDMRAATDGMVSDADLIAGAADFMALGLAKSHDEVVRLTTVAGALGMNMNQLVLTLTNQTTMRFDALGVSVDGFEEKVKALEATGMSASDAFTEAFLQQAEEQIERVGSAADTSLGSFNRLEAGAKNLGNALKKELGDGLAGAADSLGKLFNNLADGFEADLPEINQLIQSSFQNEIISYDGLTYAMQMQNDMLDEGHTKVEVAAAMWAYYNSVLEGTGVIAETTAEDLIAQSIALAAGNEYVNEGAIAWKNYMAQVGEITSLTSNFGGIIKLARSYDDIMEEIAEQTEILNNNPIDSEEWVKADERVKELQQSMTDLANQMTLDMLQATIAIDGVTEAEASSYFKMAADMGIISQEAADAAIAAYGTAVETINGYVIDDKEAKAEVDMKQAMDNLDFLQQYVLLDKTMQVYVKTNYGTSGDWWSNNYDEVGNAVGGAVSAGHPYTWQEYGYRGELFVPSADGFVLSRADAERALSNALYGQGKGGVDAKEIASAVASAMSKQKAGNTYNYTLTMPTSSNPADVRTAFELMEAWA